MRARTKLHQATRLEVIANGLEAIAPGWRPALLVYKTRTESTNPKRIKQQGWRSSLVHKRSSCQVGGQHYQFTRGKLKTQVAANFTILSCCLALLDQVSSKMPGPPATIQTVGSIREYHTLIEMRTDSVAVCHTPKRPSRYVNPASRIDFTDATLASSLVPVQCAAPRPKIFFLGALPEELGLEIKFLPQKLFLLRFFAVDLLFPGLDLLFLGLDLLFRQPQLLLQVLERLLLPVQVPTRHAVPVGITLVIALTVGGPGASPVPLVWLLPSHARHAGGAGSHPLLKIKRMKQSNRIPVTPRVTHTPPRGEAKD